MPDSTIKQFDPLTNVNPTDICWVVSDPDNTQKDCHSKIDDMLAGGVANGACAGLIKTKLAISRALTSDASDNITVSDITSTELAYLDGVTSNIQSQLDTKSATSHNHNGTYCHWRGSSSAEPSSPQEGDIYYNSTSANVQIYANSSWIVLS